MHVLRVFIVNFYIAQYIVLSTFSGLPFIIITATRHRNVFDYSYCYPINKAWCLRFCLPAALEIKSLASLLRPIE